ncbi:SpoIID/LytB domain-containing protein [Anaerosacchariphilus polymeriproducens]|uniref:SpoIID/LytB domain-containing protein n=1 Tax=Anaerosacchariphilus polymeriproducens TaxID=1812858 RepID=A0A371AV72_9FIRM|nr:SpoIID/LytB domain-containing protein [Anaerosacchariphilus polymeriproducens]RDU23473.1 SpoIID/LytB domain-containing protein [Anaerosacchariphilus polymeriproducens]
MKYIIKNFIAAAIILFALPYLLTILFETTSKSTAKTIQVSVTQGKKLKSNIDVETYLIGILAQEIPNTYEKEAIKAQAVIARTNILYYIENDIELPKYKTPDDLNKLWGVDSFWENYHKLEEAIWETKGNVIYNDNKLINASFHAVSAGKTRTCEDLFSNKKFPYLKQASCDKDLLSKNYLKIVTYSKEEFIKFCKEAYPDISLKKDKLMKQIDLTDRDSADYVKTIKLGDKKINGEAFREKFNLNSSCFTIEECEDSIRIVTKGLGHGAGVSQFTANSLAKKGRNYVQILKYFYNNIRISPYSSKNE